MPEVHGQPNVHEPQPHTRSSEPECEHEPLDGTMTVDDTDGELSLCLADCRWCSVLIRTQGYVSDPVNAAWEAL